MHALIIEDYSMISSMIEALLRESGYTSFAFASGEQEAIEAALIKCPDLITADVQLAHGSGIQAVRTICEQRAIPVIVIAAEVTDVERVLVPEAVILLKPFSERDFGKAITEAVAAIRHHEQT